ncbi:RNA polymerase sigma factor (sigma-70 family) [Pedobacter psychrotolerans]|uniref:RNA polymerase sigma factor (Sigma-70 family) n=1 Tax=Pedobacter psychrotolerans TaxID=1843235 RepID=A0A4R2HIM2_9SPHI|nr:sigma-70 family RNA polymerase sigma factor [Pedobacter psychrotolerans]TCO28837.1 RNA polymerase sigma factor (sigma-70 family) [Pedobacter psychrotolerans]
MNNELTDFELWQNFLKGDRLALNEIYNRNLSPLYHYGMRMLQDEEVVRDCLHNLFVKLWINQKNLKPTNNIKYYLISALRNTIINYKNAEKRFQKVELNEAETFDLKFSVESEYIKKEEQQEKMLKLSEAMNKLTARQKEVIYLKYYEEMDYDQIAEIMDLTKKGTYKLSARALEALREVLNVDKAILLALLMAWKR